MTIDEAIMRFKSNAEYEREHGSPAYLNSEQLCKWLKELKYLRNLVSFAEYHNVSIKRAKEELSRHEVTE